MKTSRLAVAGAVVALCTACSGTPGGDAGNPQDSGTDASVPAGDGGVVGAFQVRLVAPVPGDGGAAGYTTFTGKVYDGPTPELIVWEKQTTDGDCTLLKPRVPVCSPGCGGTAACVENNTCQPYPVARSVGAVKVTGVHTQGGATEFTLNPIVNAYQATDPLPYPAFAPGDLVRVEAAGAYFPAFTVESRGIAPLALASAALTLTSGQSVAVGWTPQSATGTTVHVKLDVSHHGGTRGKVECDTADDGSLTISAPLVSQLLALGIAGFPTIVVTRSAVGVTSISAGRVELRVASDVEKEVVIPGLRSCTSPSDCPDGGTCKSDLTCL